MSPRIQRKRGRRPTAGDDKIGWRSMRRMRPATADDLEHPDRLLRRLERAWGAIVPDAPMNRRARVSRPDSE
jgi:hypothetical protein